MNVPYSWLREWLPDLPAPEETAELLTSIGLAVEELHDYPGAAPGTVAVRLDDVAPVEGSEHLLSARAWDGTRHWQVLTGAPNARDGLVTAFAPPGTHLEALGAEIGVRTMAGQTSEGMLLSARELGVYDHATGLLELPADTEPGADLHELWPADKVIEIEITPNRADALSILGVARDLGAKLGQKPEFPFTVQLPAEKEGAAAGLTIENDTPEAAPLFTVRRIDGVTVAPSPVWLQRRLALVGLRPRNNLIDITNYVTFELGNPSHAYDVRSLEGGRIGVRHAREGERLVSLQEEELTLGSADLVISTGEEAIGLAGVIGGLDCSVGEDTTSVALEVAHFEPTVIRLAARRHHQHTDAHYRFERGVDPHLPFLASARITGLITSCAGGEAAPQLAVSGERTETGSIRFDPQRVEFLTSVAVPLDDQERYLSALGCQVIRNGDSDWLVHVPSWRFDLNIPEDLIEEVIRLHGFEHIGTSVPAMDFRPAQTDPTHRSLRAFLAASGFQELISYIFSSDAELERCRAPAATVRLTEPQGAERSVLRTALYPSLLAAARHNRQFPSLALFEVGHVFPGEETERLGLLVSGDWTGGGWKHAPRPADAFVLKGQLERLAAHLGAEFEVVNASHAQLHPGVSGTIVWNGEECGFLGQLHPEIAEQAGLPPVFLAELALPLSGSRIRYAEPQRQERNERDLALVVPATTSFAELSSLLSGPAGEHLESLTPFDVYEGEGIAEGHKSIALRFIFRHHERTLTDAEVSAVMDEVISSARAAGYDVRDR